MLTVHNILLKVVKFSKTVGVLKRHLPELSFRHVTTKTLAYSWVVGFFSYLFLFTFWKYDGKSFFWLTGVTDSHWESGQGSVGGTSWSPLSLSDFFISHSDEHTSDIFLFSDFVNFGQRKRLGWVESCVFCVNVSWCHQGWHIFIMTPAYTEEPCLMYWLSSVAQQWTSNFLDWKSFIKLNPGTRSR